MCVLRPLKVKLVKEKIVILEGGVRAVYNKRKIGEIKTNDKVLVFGNLIVEKIKNYGG